MQVTKSGSVRVDLVGGTLDIDPINYVLRDTITLNVASSLKAKVTVKEGPSDQITIRSLDYKKDYVFKQKDITEENLFNKNTFEEMTFVMQLLWFFKVTGSIELELSSGAPAGSGLGGSSAMGVTIFQALCEWKKKSYTTEESLRIVKAIEARILDSGVTGYQDYYPAFYGGVLALHPKEKGVVVEQLFSSEVKESLERNLTLVFSGKSRLSGINNWEVYKKFFDRDEQVRSGLGKIAAIAKRCYQAIQEGNWEQVFESISQEGQERVELFPNIATPEMKQLLEELKQKHPQIGLKVCGAGGGGCFLLVHPGVSREEITPYIEKFEMHVLSFEIVPPIG